MSLKIKNKLEFSIYQHAVRKQESWTGLCYVILKNVSCKWPLLEVKEKHSVLTLKEAFLCVKAILLFLPIL